MNRITILVVAGLSLTLGACATQQQPMTTAQNTASLQCQYAIADNDRNYDELFLMSGRPVFDERGNPQGLSGRGYVAYHQCMTGKGYEIADAQPE